MMSKTTVPEKDRIDHYLYIDEFQNFITDEFETILSEARKYKLNLNIAHQYTQQLIDAPKVLNSIKGNVGNMILFGLGEDDPDKFIKGFSPELTVSDLVNLPPFHGYVKVSEPSIGMAKFSIKTIAPWEKEQKQYLVGYGKQAEDVSKRLYAVFWDQEKDEKTIRNLPTHWVYTVSEEDVEKDDPLLYISEQSGIPVSVIIEYNQNRNIDLENLKV